MDLYPWFDVAPNPLLGAAMGLIVAAMLFVACAAKFAGLLWMERRWLAADLQADIRDRMSILKTLGVSPGVRYQLAMEEGLVAETPLELVWVAEMLKKREPEAEVGATAAQPEVSR